ncbi:uncharacterized protein [Panulirus ornatus]|uniref:uncharacterized protein n=1 Tax=Panulirus ornatus TaxID=150431 RepID=UPI003A845015
MDLLQQQKATYEMFRRQLSESGIPEMDYRLVEKAEREGQFLGEGTFGSCYRIDGPDGVPLCVKILLARSLDRQWKSLLQEARQMVRVKDIVGMIRLVGVSLWPKPAIVTRYAGTSLSSLLDDGKVSRMNAVKIITQILHIMNEMTKANLAHADLKTNNIVVEETSTEPRVTIIDLGMTQKFGYIPGRREKKKNPIYAPETYDGCCLGPPTQVYQVGRVLKSIFKHAPVEDEELQRLAKEATGIAADRPKLSTMFKRGKELLVSEYLRSVLERPDDNVRPQKRTRGDDASEAPNPKRANVA